MHFVEILIGKVVTQLSQPTASKISHFLFDFSNFIIGGISTSSQVTLCRSGYQRFCNKESSAVEVLIVFQVAYKKRERAQKRKEMEVLMKDNLLNILTVPGTPIRCETQDELEQLNKSTSQQSFDKNNLYP